MRDSIGQPNSRSLFHTEICDVANGKYLPDIPVIEGQRVIKSCHNPLRENIVTCKDPNVQAFLDEVGGLGLDLKFHSHLAKLPPYIPILDFGACKHGGIPDNIPIVGVSLCDLVSSAIILKAGSFHIQDKIRFRTDILNNLGFKGKKVILFLSGADSLIENIWYHRDECDFFKVIQDMGFWGVSGINFSVIGGECAFSQALNMKRSLFSAFELSRFGINAIPHVYAISQSHIARWITWFKQNPLVTYFVMNCQLQKTDRDIKQVIQSIKYILSSCPGLHAIVQGFPLPASIDFAHVLERVHFADAQPVKNAQSHKYLSSYNDAFKCLFSYDRSKPLRSLIQKNITDRQMLFNYLRIENSSRLNNLTE